MLEVIIPFLVSVLIPADGAGSMETAAIESTPAETATETATASAEPVATAGPTAPDRQPEPQIATGKFTTALETKPIFQATQAQWVAVREYEGKDWVYFTNILAWRCGLWELRYGINTAEATEVLPMEPCNLDYSTPNAMIDMETYPPFITLEPGSVDLVVVELVFDDGDTMKVAYGRSQVLIP